MSEEIIMAHMQFGSQVYGTSTPDSDTDFKSVFIPSTKDLLLQRATKVSRNRSTGDERSKNTAEDIDVEEFSLHGFMKLACEGQTVAIDMLFVPYQFYWRMGTRWESILCNRHLLISRSIAPFVGYCRAQANKYGIKGSRMAAAKAAVEVLASLEGNQKLGDYFEVDDPRLMRLLEHEHIEIVEKRNANGHGLHHLSVCGKLAPFTLRVDRGLAIFEGLWRKYGERSRKAMNNEGVDWKALMHARRIQDQAIELLSTGAITFPRENADDLLKIRLGERPYKEVAEEIEDGMNALELAMEESTLPVTPNRLWADSVVVDCYREALINA